MPTWFPLLNMLQNPQVFRYDHYCTGQIRSNVVVCHFICYL